MPVQPIVSGWNKFKAQSTSIDAKREVSNQQTIYQARALAGRPDTTISDAIYFHHKDQPNAQFSNSYESGIKFTAAQINELTQSANPFFADLGNPPETVDITFRSAENAIQYLKTIKMMNEGYFGDPITPVLLESLQIKLNDLKTKGPDDALKIAGADRDPSSALDGVLPAAPGGQPKTHINDFLRGNDAANPLAEIDIKEIQSTVIKNKFLQNPELAASLIAVGNKPLIHANPNDKKAGFGRVVPVAVVAGAPPQPPQVELVADAKDENELGVALNAVLRDNQPQLQQVIQNDQAAKSAKESKELSAKVTPAIEAFNKAALNLKTIVKRSPSLESEYNPLTRYQYLDSSLSKEIDNLEKSLLSNHAGNALDITKIFAALNNQTEQLHYQLANGQGANNLDAWHQAVKKAETDLKDFGIDANAKLQELQNKHLEEYIKKNTELMNAAHFTAYSQAIAREMNQRNLWGKLSAQGITVQGLQAKTSTGLTGYQKTLEAGEYKLKGAKEDVTLLLKGDNKTGFTVKYNSRDPSEAGLKKAVNQAISLLMANGSTEITLGYSKFNPALMSHYFERINRTLNEITTPPNQKNVLFNLDPEFLANLHQTLNDSEKVTVGGKRVSATAQLKEFENAIKAHNTRVTGLKTNYENDAKADVKDTNVVADVATNINKNRINEHIKILNKAQTDGLSAKPAEQITTDKATVEKLQKAMNEIKKQQFSLEQQFATARNTAEKDALKAQARKITELSSKFVTTLDTVQIRLEASKSDEAKAPAAEANQLREQFQNIRIMVSQEPLSSDLKRSSNIDSLAPIRETKDLPAPAQPRQGMRHP
jgi:predicted NAD-dependent protein-ADP-ribosyltransferase YbiA (DUF1768 family)